MARMVMSGAARIHSRLEKPPSDDTCEALALTNQVSRIENLGHEQREPPGASRGFLALGTILQ